MEDKKNMPTFNFRKTVHISKQYLSQSLSVCLKEIFRLYEDHISYYSAHETSARVMNEIGFMFWFPKELPEVINNDRIMES